jgi:hypothetical protein
MSPELPKVTFSGRNYFARKLLFQQTYSGKLFSGNLLEGNLFAKSNIIVGVGFVIYSNLGNSISGQPHFL